MGIAKKNKIPVCITPHGPFEKDNKRSKIFKIIDFLYDKFIGVWELKRYTCVISISKWELKYLESFNVENIELIPNGINSLFLEKKLKLSKKDKVKNKVLYMGRVDPVKRLDWIQYAASKLSDINFLIKGPFQDFEVESTSENLKVENKVFTAQELIKDLDDSDIFVLPSIRESFGIVLIEAMARGKLVISSDTKGANDIIENGVNGFIVINENELVEAIEYSYEHWDKLLSIRENAISTANQYNEEHTVKNLSSTYKKILN
jgi:glycosyltransferase involved in cell wall biosynthesis